jgi:type I restriction-modification system DNA methylase subunit
MSRDLGDFQTPPQLVDEVLHCLTRAGQTWTRVLEPTCGYGNFIKGLFRLPSPPREIQGIEIQDAYVKDAQDTITSTASTFASIRQANLFHLDLHHDLTWQTTGPLLIVGNPPWITNAELGSLGSDNIPIKSNFKGLSGFDAMTGRANFDIAEYILLKLNCQRKSMSVTKMFLKRIYNGAIGCHILYGRK